MSKQFGHARREYSIDLSAGVSMILNWIDKRQTRSIRQMPMNRRVFGRQLRAGACLGHGSRSSHHCIAHVTRVGSKRDRVCRGERYRPQVEARQARRRFVVIRKAKAVWRGSGRAGNGVRTTDSGVLRGTLYSFKTRFEPKMVTSLVRVGSLPRPVVPSTLLKVLLAAGVICACASASVGDASLESTGAGAEIRIGNV